MATARQISETGAPPGRPGGRLETPVRLWLMLVASVAVILVAGCTAGIGLADRESTASHTAHSTEVLYTDVQNLAYSLADANATAATSLLVGAETPSGFSARFDGDVEQAELLLSEASQQVAGDAYASAQLTGLGEQIPVFAGLVGQAQADNRLGFPVAGAYLRQASDLLTGPMLTETHNVLGEQQKATNAGVGSASAFDPLLLGVALLALVVLWQVGRRLARLTHRRFNTGLVGGLCVVLALFGWSLVAFAGASSDGSAATADFADLVHTQSEISELSLAQSWVALQQIDRGEDQGADAQHTDAAYAKAALQDADPGKDTGAAPDSAARTTAEAAFGRLDTCAQKAIQLASDGQYVAAVAATVGAPGPNVGQGGCEPLAEKLHADQLNVFDAEQARFDQDAAALSSDYAGSGALPLGLAFGVLGAGAAAYGINRRLAEFR